MEIINRIPRMISIGRDLRNQKKRIGLVTTSGALHEGHLSLATRARELCDTVVISIVPVQLPAYVPESSPVNLARDAELAFTRGVDFIFAPASNDVFPDRFLTRVNVESLSEKLEGAGRPGYLSGVTTAANKLLNIVHPHFIVLGRKNAQQVVGVKRMVRELSIDVEIVVCPTVREEDGLALSSNNAALGTDARKAALVLRRALERCRSLSNSGERDAGRLIASMRAMLEAEPLARIDYIAITDTDELNDVDVISSAAPALVSIAAYISDTRLTDNIVLNGEL